MSGRDAAAVISGEQDVLKHDSGSQELQCENCGALLWREERLSLCCARGKVKLDPFTDPLSFLEDLWTFQNLDSRQFRKHARQLNNAFALASQWVSELLPPNGGWSPSCLFKVNYTIELDPFRLKEARKNLSHKFTSTILLIQQRRRSCDLRICVSLEASHLR